MASSKHLSAPLPTTKMPPSVPYILANETAERFAFYGMGSILVVFMTQYLLGPGGALKPMADESATAWFHWFTAGVYFMSIVGAVVSDLWLGKFKTIIWFSLVYCAGFAVLSLDHTRWGLAIGMVLIATGAGVIKPCISANVGDQFGASNKHLIEKIYSWFYFSINVGSAISMWYCPILLENYGPAAGFGLPAGLMVVATIAYWLGRRKLVDVPPAGLKAWAGIFEKEQRASLIKISVIFLLISMFFALYFQSQSAWVLQAKKMNLHWLGIDWLPAQPQVANSILILVMVPLFAYVIYPAINRFWPLTLLRKMQIGMFLTAATFVVPIWIETQIQHGGRPSIGWQFMAYVFLTASEIMVSITSLEFAYTQAPNKMKSLIQSINLLSTSLGNIIVAVVNKAIENPDGTSKLPGASYYWFFAIVMFVTAVLFVPVSLGYKSREYIQEEVPAS